VSKATKGPAPTKPGPHGGTMVDIAGGRVEVVLADDGGVFRFLLYCFDLRDRPTPPVAHPVTVETERDDGKRERYLFLVRDDRLESTGIVRVPHEFEITLSITHKGWTDMHVHRVHFRHPVR
jgi:hypothetical protein